MNCFSLKKIANLLTEVIQHLGILCACRKLKSNVQERLLRKNNRGRNMTDLQVVVPLQSLKLILNVRCLLLQQHQSGVEQLLLLQLVLYGGFAGACQPAAVRIFWTFNDITFRL